MQMGINTGSPTLTNGKSANLAAKYKGGEKKIQLILKTWQSLMEQQVRSTKDSLPRTGRRRVGAKNREKPKLIQVLTSWQLAWLPGAKYNATQRALFHSGGL